MPNLLYFGKNKFYVDVKLSKDGHKVFISNSKDDFILDLG